MTDAQQRESSRRRGRRQRPDDGSPDRAAFRRILDREGGEPPRPGDELPPDLVQWKPR